MVRWYRLSVAIFIGLFALVFAFPFFYTGRAEDRYPKLANYYLRWEIEPAVLPELARYDVLILDMETQIRSPEMLKKLRQLNPDIILLAYITSQEIRQDGYLAQSILRTKLAKQIDDPWFLTTSAGQRISFWPGTNMLNVADNAPLLNGKRFNSVLAQFVSGELLSTGLWDGVFYDNAWDGITWHTKNDVDLDKDGVPDEKIDEHWRSGMRFLFNETRRLAGDNIIIVGNGGATVYRDEMNGTLLENFPNHAGWKGTMGVYSFFENGKRTPQVIVLNRNTLNSGKKNNFASMRYGLASTLMGNGYYSFDYGDQDHSQTWWYDEFDADLGAPSGSAIAVGGEINYAEGVWRRDYKNGLALVNSSNSAAEVDLGGEYEKIIGRQDPTVNDGSITSRVNLAARDGLVMYKTFQTVDKVYFKNGSFARFFKSDGARARNGFFVFEDGYPGGSKIYNGDLDGDGIKEKIVATGSKLEIFNNRGERWFNGYPFGANFKAELNIALGKLTAGDEQTLIVAPSAGDGNIMIYNYHGGIVNDSWYPLGKRYRGGFSVAIVPSHGSVSGQLIIATGAGRPAEIIIYNSTLDSVHTRFFPFGRGQSGPISIAIGSFANFGDYSVAAVVQKTKNPVVREFTLGGKKLKSFSPRGIIGSDFFSLGAMDVNFDGRDEIVVMSAN